MSKNIRYREIQSNTHVSTLITKFGSNEAEWDQKISYMLLTLIRLGISRESIHNSLLDKNIHSKEDIYNLLRSLFPIDDVIDDYPENDYKIE